MANLQDIRHRINSVTSTKQITSAMNMVATSRLRHAKEAAINNGPYAEKVAQVVQGVAASAEGTISHPLLQSNESGKRLILVLTADRGLAGAYTSNACKMAEAQVESKENTQLVVVGRKGSAHFKNRGYDVVKDYTGVSERPDFESARRIALDIMNRFETGEIKDVLMVYTKFISAIQCEPQVVHLLPFKKEKNAAGPHTEYIFEPDAETVLTHLLPMYFFTTVYAALLQSAASEQSSRMNAMSNATDNADDLINKMNITYNKVRQAGITTELNEIVAGAEGQK